MNNLKHSKIRDEVARIIEQSRPSCGLPKECNTECGECGADRILSYLGDELVDIIDEALAELAHRECPYCQAYIGLDKYIDRTDIDKWLKRKGVAK